MTSKAETRYGTIHGSGKVFTAFVINQLNRGAAQNKNPDAANNLALAIAYANGCLNPQANIDRNGAWLNAIDDARNSFLFGHMLAVTADSGVKRGNTDLYYQLSEGEEKLENNRVIEPQNVPDKVSKEKKLTGFAQTVPYAITSTFWRAYDELTKGHADIVTHQRVFNALSSELDNACRKAPNMRTLKNMAFGAFYRVIKTESSRV